MLGKALVYSYFALPLVLTIVFMVWQLIRIRRTTRWPIADKLLRPPGESCRRKLEQFDENYIFHLLVPMILWLLFLLTLLKIQLMLAPNSWAVFFVVLAIGVVAAI